MAVMHWQLVVSSQKLGYSIRTYIVESGGDHSPDLQVNLERPQGRKHGVDLPKGIA